MQFFILKDHSKDVLPLQPEFRQLARKVIEDSLRVFSQYTSSVSRGKKVWKYDNEFDFVYGYFVGQLNGSIITIIQFMTGREATEEEKDEVDEIIQTYAKDARGIFSKLKS